MERKNKKKIVFHIMMSYFYLLHARNIAASLKEIKP